MKNGAEASCNSSIRKSSMRIGGELVVDVWREKGNVSDNCVAK